MRTGRRAARHQPDAPDDRYVPRRTGAPRGKHVQSSLRRAGQLRPLVLLRLAGPMQSWGTQSRFSIRDGASEPSKSGVVGLLCAALGRPRSEPVDDLAAVRMGVRVDLPGVARVDYQTAGGTHRVGERYGVIKADGSRGETVTSRRHYLADADFLVGLESDDALVEQLRDAVEQPRWQLFLGRKSYLPATPVLVGVRDDALEEALRVEPWPGSHRTDQQRLRDWWRMPQNDSCELSSSSKTARAKRFAQTSHLVPCLKLGRSRRARSGQRFTPWAPTCRSVGIMLMYLSRLLLNPRSRVVRRDLADCQSLDRSVLSAFPLKSDRAVGAREEFGVLHRLEPSRPGKLPVLLVQSAETPDWIQLPPDYLAPIPDVNPATVSLRPFLDSLQPGERLRFRLRANPTKKVDTKSGPNGERRNGRRVKLKTEAEQVAWLQRKASEESFEVLAVHTSSDTLALNVIDQGQAKGWRPLSDQKAGHLAFGTVVFDGHLRIIDPDVFRRTMERGLGSGKAYGFGLLSVGRPNGAGR